MTQEKATANARDFDNCAYVTKGGKPCGALRWYHADHARHKFVEPKRVLTVEDERNALLSEVAQLREAATAALSLLENIGTGKWAKTPAGDKLRAALSKKEGER